MTRGRGATDAASRTIEPRTADAPAAEGGPAPVRRVRARLALRAALLAAVLLVPGTISARAAWVDEPSQIDGLPARTCQPGALTPGTLDPDDLKPSYREGIPGILDSSGGELVVSARAVADYFDARQTTYNKLQRLPLFKVSQDAALLRASPDVVVAHPLEGFSGFHPADLRVVKALGGDVFMRYTLALAPGLVTGRTFAVVSEDAITVMGPDDEIADGCFIALCVNTGDPFFNLAEDGVVDPAFVYTPGGPGPEPPPEPDPVPGPVPVYPRYYDAELPRGTGVARSVAFPARPEESGLRRELERIVERAPGGYLALSHIVVENIVAAHPGELYINSVVPLPVIRGEVTYSRRTGLFMIDPSTLPGVRSLYGKRARDIRIAKAVTAKGADALFFDLATTVAGLTDGKFAITESPDGRPPFLRYDDELKRGHSYYLLLAIADNRSYDGDDEMLSIADPCLAGAPRAHAVDDGGGGCGTARFAPAVMLLALPLLLASTRRRW